MPNWVTCKFQHISDMKIFRNVVINPKTNQIDFNILLPMPETLDISSPQYGELPEGFVLPDIKNSTLDSFLQECLDKGTSASIALAHYNRQKFGFPDWYNWRINHWGTKWNALCEEDAAVDGLPEFRTAWNIPEGWLRTLAKHVDFTLLYADEDMGNNCGRVKAFHGEMAIEMPEYGAESIALAYYVRYGDNGKEFLTECSTKVPNNENYQNAVQNYNDYINRNLK